jgi:hypothetical protein
MREMQVENKQHVDWHQLWFLFFLVILIGLTKVASPVLFFDTPGNFSHEILQDFVEKQSCPQLFLTCSNNLKLTATETCFKLNGLT